MLLLLTLGLLIFMCGSIRHTAGKGGNVTSARWQVILCDPIWHVSSRSGEASRELLYSVYFTFTFYLRHSDSVPAPNSSIVNDCASVDSFLVANRHNLRSVALCPFSIRGVGNTDIVGLYVRASD